MEFYDLVEERRSIRDYGDSRVNNEKLYRILESATYAPSWSCKHCWRLIVVDDRELINKTAQTVNDSNPVKGGLLKAPMMLVICADPANAEEIDEKEYFMADCGIAMEHIMLAACNEGLASCWIGLFDEDNLKSILEIPDPYRVVALSPLGFPAQKPEARKNKTIKDIVFHDKWENEMIFK